MGKSGQDRADKGATRSRVPYIMLTSRVLSRYSIIHSVDSRVLRALAAFVLSALPALVARRVAVSSAWVLS